MGRNTTDDPNKYQITHLQNNHREMLRLRSLGMTNTQISEQLHCTPQAVSIVVNSELGKLRTMELQAERDQKIEECKKQLDEMAPLALTVLRDTLEDKNASHAIKLKASRDVLDRIGLAPVQKTASLSLGGMLTPEILAGMYRRAADAGSSIQLPQDIIEVEVSSDQVSEAYERQDSDEQRNNKSQSEELEFDAVPETMSQLLGGGVPSFA